ncbi:serine/threonine-protein kinase [Spirillospora albida]|uniref:serine/threonine-protein kinase n=1 Tax=Spirillospora albida TaxID=58123 RepID=UPI00069042E4|nr:serine/threonine-protein kinase [Spirillospora albida]
MIKAIMEALRPEDPPEIGGYPVLARLGAGGMGQVYLGLTGGGRHIAVKVIREDFEGPQALARFRREVQTVGRVRSRCAAALVGAGLETPPYWLATEYIPGPTLRQAVVQHGPLPPDTCLRLLAALAQGLMEIHSQGVQHRDLKPGNVILAPDGPRLIDFGIARGEDQTQITQTGAWNGTPGYVAPEVLREQAPVPASDMFSLAGTVAYAATGRPPFGGGPIEAIIHRTLSGDLDLTGVDTRLAGILTRCAAKDPARRITPQDVLQEVGPLGHPAQDPAYHRLVGAIPQAPLSVGEAATAGLLPRERTRTGGGPSRSRAPMLLAAAAVAAVVLTAAVVTRTVLNGPEGGAKADAGTSTTRPAGTASPGGAPTGSAPRTGPPTGEPFVKQPDQDFQTTRWTKKGMICLPAVRSEPGSPQDLQTSAPRQPVAKNDPVELSARFKYSRPKDYYIAALVRPPVWMLGNASNGETLSRPVKLPTDGDDATLRYPADFPSDRGYPIDRGEWTVIWLHVHPNGDAYYIGCDGFEGA